MEHVGGPVARRKLARDDAYFVFGMPIGPDGFSQIGQRLNMEQGTHIGIKEMVEPNRLVHTK